MTGNILMRSNTQNCVAKCIEEKSEKTTQNFSQMAKHIRNFFFFFGNLCQVQRIGIHQIANIARLDTRCC